MLNFKAEVANILAEKIDSLDYEKIFSLIETPPSYDMGDYAFPVFSLAKVYRKNPNIIAAEVAESINSDLLERVESKAAYVNFFIDKNKLVKEVLNTVEQEKEEFGRVNVGKGKDVIIEYSSPNIAKPFHIGHIRTTIIGDSLKRIYKFLGYNVTSYNHLGDYGTQFGKLIVAIEKWGNREEIEKNPIPELLKLYVKINQETENNEELLNECRYWFKELEEGNEKAVELWKWIREVSMEEFERVYKILDVDFDFYMGESFYSDKMAREVEVMERKGILEISNGAKIVNLDEHNIPPALVIKSDGSTIYLTRDIATAVYRQNEHNPEKIIYVVGSQQILHFKQLKYVLEKMGYDWFEKIVHVPFGMVSLQEGTLSTRRGNVVYLEDLLNKSIEKVMEILNNREKEKGQNIDDKEKLAKQVGVGAIKFQELFNQRIKDYTFDWENTLSFEGETGPYVQYTHARINSILERGNFEQINVEDNLLKEESEINLLRLIYNFSNVVIDAHEKYEPYFITRHITEVAKEFNKYYNSTQILVEDSKLKGQRLMLAYAVKTVIKSGLGLLGIEAPNKM
ncbi:arginine--tRNA ligase [Peptoniphilus indolicus]|uniref:Arginine--tRNA ligase n=2 Tax=Peptoniphilus indolicus TaxID=33030 RepID=G4D6K7_9FIRM|nr:arginine--tRNA ligase [Peptoniphilus indolicus]EGY76470.1 arginine--tRNA ligase [Peptoniphilus indolicus ATCC 29427]SUB74467.1 Arginine--tRNA ligase [Peptoniphilus indolicus]